MTETFLRKLQEFGSLSDQERRAIQSVPLTVQHVRDNQDLVCQGDRPSHCPFLLDGFACRYKTLASGQRQIMAFHVPSDLCDLTSLLSDKLDHSIGTLTAAKVVLVPYASILSWTRSHPGLTKLLWRVTLLDAAMTREWIVNVGRRTAYQRTAHLLCEHLARMHRAGLASGLTCGMPMTQVELADALGLTPVHVNRVLQILRGEGLIELSDGRLSVPDWHAIKEAAGFDPSYLYDACALG